VLFVEARGILEDSMLRIQAVNRAAMGFWIPGKDPLQTDEADTPFISDDDLEDIMAVATDSASASTFRKLCIMQGVPEHLADQVCLELLRASFSPGKRNDPLAGIATRHVAPQKSPLGRAVDDAIRQGAK
jgi:hypothetical protein